MTWVRLDDDFFERPAVLTLAHDQKVLFLALLAYSNRQLTDGHLSTASVRYVAGAQGIAALEGAASALVSAGLWRPAAHGWEIVDYFETQPSREEVLERRAKVASRVQKHRMQRPGNRVTNPVSNGVGNGVTHPVSNGVGNTAPDPDPDPDPMPMPMVHPEPRPAANAAAPAAAAHDDQVAQFAHRWEEVTGSLPTNPVRRQLQLALKDGKPIDRALVEFVESGGRTWKYFKTILDRMWDESREGPIDERADNIAKVQQNQRELKVNARTRELVTTGLTWHEALAMAKRELDATSSAGKQAQTIHTPSPQEAGRAMASIATPQLALEGFAVAARDSGSCKVGEGVDTRDAAGEPGEGVAERECDAGPREGVA